MRDPALIRKLEAIHGLLSRSFVRYIVEAGGPVVGDEWDRKALEAFGGWRAGDLAIIGKIEEVLAAEKVHPVAAAWPVGFSQYHYAGAAHLVRPAIEHMAKHAGGLEEAAAGLEAWPEAADLASRAVREARERIAALEALDRDRPKPAPKPSAKKGVSACRW